jgi:integrase
MAGKRQFGSLRKLPSGRWQARYTAPSGEVFSATTTFPTKGDANRWLALAEADLARGEWSDPRLGQTTAGEWAARWLATTVDLKPSTQVWYDQVLRNHVLPVLGRVPIGRIDRAAVEAFSAELTRAGVGPGTVRAALFVLRRLIDTAVSSGAVRSNPCDGVRRPRSSSSEMHFLTAEQVTELAEAIAHPPIRPGGGEHRRRDYPEYGLLVRLAAYSGLRAGEIEALRVGRLDLLRGVIEVAESLADVRGTLVFGPPKTYQRRRVPIPVPCATSSPRISRSAQSRSRRWCSTRPTVVPSVTVCSTADTSNQPSGMPGCPRDFGFTICGTPTLHY